MKKRRKPEIGKKLMSSILAMTMAMELAPVAALTASAAVDEKLVNSLTSLYDGDEARAREELEALYEAGIIDETGSMVEMDIREDGEAVTLEDISAKILSGTETGDLTVNGHAATTDQILKINETKNALEIAKMLAQDVKITDEHVENLESLIQGIADGTVDLDAAIESGSLSMNNQQNTRKLAAAPLRAPLATASTDDFPSTKVTTGTVDADAEGKFTAPYISGAEYDANHSFTLLDLENKTYYTDSATEGIVSDGIITLSCENTATISTSDTTTFTVTATLNKAQPFDVSFDWAAAGGIGVSGSGTVIWTAGTTGNKTINVTIPKKTENDLWQGSKSFVINVGNVKNAMLSGNKTAWSKTVSVSASDRSSILDQYPWVNLGSFTKEDAEADEDGENYYFEYNLPDSNNNSWCQLSKYNADWVQAGRHMKFTITLTENLPEKPKIDYEDGVEFVEFGVAITNTDEARAAGKRDGRKLIGFYYDGAIGQKTISAEADITQADADSIIYNGKADIVSYLEFPYRSTATTQISKLSVDYRCPAVELQVTDLSVPAGTYYSGQTVPVTVTLSQYAVANADTKLTINGQQCSILDAADTESNKFTFGYTVKDVDTGVITVTGISGLINSESKSVTVSGQLPANSIFDTNDNVTIVSDVKQPSLDMANVKYGISDGEPTKQEVTVLIPFKSGASVEWVGSESADCTTNGNGFAMMLPTYGNVTIKDYLNGAYFSYDNGKTRLPVYVVRSSDGSNTPVALVTRFVPPKNETSYLRYDTLNLFMDTTVGISNADKYLDTWDKAVMWDNKCGYFDGTDKEAAPIVVGTGYSYYVKGGVMFDQTQYTSRGTADYASKTENGWLNLDDGNHVYLQDAANPQNRYDVELVANDDLYKCIRDGARGFSLKIPYIYLINPPGYGIIISTTY